MVLKLLMTAQVVVYIILLIYTDKNQRPNRFGLTRGMMLIPILIIILVFYWAI